MNNSRRLTLTGRKRLMPLFMTILAVLTLLAPVQLFSSDLPKTTCDGDARVLGLGGAVTGSTANTNIHTMNPAALFLQPEARLHVGIDYLDSFPLDVDFGDGLVSFIQHPSISYNIHYTGNGWSFGIFSDYCLDNKGPIGGDLQVDVERTNGMEVGFSFGIGPVAIGADFRAAKKSALYQRRIENSGDIVTIATDLLQEVFLAEYNPQGEESFEMGLGLMIDYGSLTIGAYSENFVDFFDDSANGVSIDPERILSGLDVGISLSTDPFTGFGRLRLVRLLTALDVHNLGDSSNRTVNAGLEGSLMLTGRLSLSVQLGYYTALPDFEDVLSILEIEEGFFTAGVSADLIFMTVNTALVVPGRLLTAVFDDTLSTVAAAGERVSGKVSLGFFL
jgi:hypothetical protein